MLYDLFKHLDASSACVDFIGNNSTQRVKQSIITSKYMYPSLSGNGPIVSTAIRSQGYLLDVVNGFEFTTSLIELIF